MITTSKASPINETRVVKEEPIDEFFNSEQSVSKKSDSNFESFLDKIHVPVVVHE